MKGKIDTHYLKDERLSYLDYKGEKKIFVYTPPSYSSETALRYPVIYAFDGQNLFSAPYGEYACEAPSSVGLDMILEDGNIDAIVVGIYNGEGEFTRDRELTMSKNFGTLVDTTESQGFKVGTLDNTGEFIISTLKRFIDTNYRTNPNADFTMILGASSGGLAAYYLGLKYADVFGKVCTFSPATGLFLESDWLNFYNKIDFSKSQKILIYCGKNSSDWLENYLYGKTCDDVLSSCKIKQSLILKGFNAENVTEYFVDGAVHNETFWHEALKNNVDFFRFD